MHSSTKSIVRTGSDSQPLAPASGVHQTMKAVLPAPRELRAAMVDALTDILRDERASND